MTWAAVLLVGIALGYVAGKLTKELCRPPTSASPQQLTSGPNEEMGQSATSRLYSITSSARCKNVPGIVRPSAFAVLRFTTSSNLTGAWTGSSLGFSPLRMRST
jgi:hypothetical protein